MTTNTLAQIMGELEEAKKLIGKKITHCHTPISVGSVALFILGTEGCESIEVFNKKLKYNSSLTQNSLKERGYVIVLRSDCLVIPYSEDIKVVEEEILVNGYKATEDGNYWVVNGIFIFKDHIKKSYEFMNSFTGVDFVNIFGLNFDNKTLKKLLDASSQVV